MVGPSKKIVPKMVIDSLMMWDLTSLAIQHSHGQWPMKMDTTYDDL